MDCPPLLLNFCDQTIDISNQTCQTAVVFCCDQAISSSRSKLDHIRHRCTFSIISVDFRHMSITGTSQPLTRSINIYKMLLLGAASCSIGGCVSICRSCGNGSTRMHTQRFVSWCPPSVIVRTAGEHTKQDCGHVSCSIEANSAIGSQASSLTL